MPNKRFDINLLKKYSENIEILNDIFKLTGEARIKFKCPCGNEDARTFRCIVQTEKMICSKCIKNYCCKS